jgi:pimeloyl-ACP methyl ester carboxylesterase
MISQRIHEVALPVQIALNGLSIYGDVQVPQEAIGLVIFVHGSGSSRFSIRNKHVAEQLNENGLGTLLLDLLTKEEHEIDEETMQYRFDIPLLARRSTLAVLWAGGEPGLQQLPIGLFGASTGAAAALITAAELKNKVVAVVSRGGRPDLAEDVLDQVEAPTLLIVGGADHTVLELNRKAAGQMHCRHRLHIVPGATHLFEEPGALEEVATVAGKWFLAHLQDHRAVSTKIKMISQMRRSA